MQKIPRSGIIGSTWVRRKEEPTKEIHVRMAYGISGSVTKHWSESRPLSATLRAEKVRSLTSASVGSENLGFSGHSSEAGGNELSASRKSTVSIDEKNGEHHAPRTKGRVYFDDDPGIDAFHPNACFMLLGCIANLCSNCWSLHDAEHGLFMHYRGFGVVKIMQTLEMSTFWWRCSLFIHLEKITSAISTAIVHIC